MKYENRLLAFFDILGFKKHLSDETLDDLYLKYGYFLDKANKDIFGNIGTIYGDPTVSNFNKSIVFSDSIILISYDINEVKNINNFLLSCITLMQEAIKHGFILRGAIGYGEAIYDEERNIFLSKEYAELYVKESKQNWAGCGIFVSEEIKQKILNAIFGNQKIAGYQIWNVATDTLLKQKKIKSHIRASSPIVEYKIPRLDENQWCLNYLFTLDTSEFKKLLELLESEPSGKCYNTKKFYDYIFSLEDTGEIIESIEPIHKIKIMMTQTSVKIKFEDKLGNGTYPASQNITIGFI